MIEQSQIEQFQRDGFLVVEGVLSVDEVAALQHAFYHQESITLELFDLRLLDHFRVS